MTHCSVQYNIIGANEKLWRNIHWDSPACSFHQWSVGSESFSYPWCFAVVETNVAVTQVEKCLSELERRSADYYLLLQPKNTHTVMHQRIRAHTHFSAQVCWGNVVESCYWRAPSEESWRWGGCRDAWGWGDPQFIVCSTGTVTKLFAAAVARRTTLLSCVRQTEIHYRNTLFTPCIV